MLDTLLLSRIQFAANISFHILFPTITIALAWFLAFFKLKYDLTEHPVWLRAYRFWVKIFALTFALGVVSGITMSFQFGTNWPGFMEKVGNIAGPLLGYEVLTAFFMEATFLGIMLFGMKRVPPKIHTLATFIVAIGTTLSAFWILSLNSWMQTPTGFELRDGIVYPTDWFEVIFNPSFGYRFFHMLLASALTASFLIAGVSAYRMLKNDEKHAPKKALTVALTVAALLTPLQAFVGDLHGLNTLKHQPQKIAAMEGVWETEKGAPLLLFAIPNEEERRNDFALGIPNMASFILTHDVNGEIKGLNEFKGEHPPVKPVFFGFRIMVGMGMLMILVAFVTRFTLWKKGELPKWQLKALVAMTFSGWVATLAGWYVTEIGRQPYIVSGILRVEDAVTTIASENVLFTLIGYLTIYAILLYAYIRTLFHTASKSVEVEEYDMKEFAEEVTRV
ncbi:MULTISPECIES: cytochrome ubiquinol oxidase subunit I [Pseudoalteromonas]|uniref:Cytochrome d ubiquinol oxidase subunit I n=1 Tax=Pseudoalteromonas piscicida TaxID=43662 RepID=A0AAQ2IRM3_PSEO7|nr:MULTISPECIES: cytochrome ubiquinol oxidase subunit I [Pseudoalteromonas]ATD10220.1 cytochrome d ubiquinol oxidase subunit I [Pseudoalteromonas piscicida]MCO7198004.1 cytochrome ubiquinol oxidase subunit I [Pseudoalteromonas sp. OANN1]MDP4486541.1 cytochrome ubiquinol oxidase subunit I [Pseudoalteromonas piscicida]TMN40609.1 cytochrome ubiquinol oxidase subunit I [Pseudoalteromonas piscicida]TMN42038.1 cytochrome ubiquinol oxidase subunit I [Pseudoalteromonas piscicida]